MPYPPARTADVVDTYHGVRVADPYRWLEDADSEETLAWVAAQNALTRSRLDGPARADLVDRLTRFYDYPRTSVPLRRGRRRFFTFNRGLQNQPILYVQDPGGTPRVLLDPNTLTADGTAALTAFFADDDGMRVACALSAAGSDRQELVVLDAATAGRLDDRLLWLKFASVAWTPEGDGFYYTRFPEPGSVPPGDEQYFPRVCFHRLGTPQSADPVLHERPGERGVVFHLDVTEDGRWLVVTAYQGASDRSEVWLLDRRAGGLHRLVGGFDHAWTFVGSDGSRLLFVTDERAPRGRIVALDPAGGAAQEIVPQTEGRLTSAVVAGRTLAVCRLTNASDGVTLHALDGRLLGAVDLPPFVSLTGLDGTSRHAEIGLGVWSYGLPPASFTFDTDSGTLERFDPSAALAPGASGPPALDVETRQVWYRSKDGTRVSMFVVHGRGLPADGNRPVLLTGYGGFNINMTPLFDPGNLALFERGGVLAVPQLRGGGEYGEAWHEAGMRERKQNVFDDFIAAAEWLIAEGITSPRRLAIEGGSNGGLLTAAVMLQRPDLFGAVVCRVPVADMLRYHLFTVGRYWIPEYGSADDPEQFAWLFRYSPYHNVVRGRVYPPMLVTTADTDDRVSPGMAKKLAARLQADAAGGPFLIRVETKAGHGAGKPVAKMIEEDADIFAFVFQHLEVT